MRIALHGATGKMGLAVARLVATDPGLQLVGAVCSSEDPARGRDVGELAGAGALGVVADADVAAALLGADVVIDFSVAAAAANLFALAARHGVAVVSGTTNLDPAAERALEQATAAVSVLWAPNMSLGIQVLAEVVEHAVKRLGTSFDVEIVELHHRRKVDAPSGTARRLARAAKTARPGLVERSAREGHVGARPGDELGVWGVRGGDVVGDHTVYLLGAGERLELTHRACSRDLFARGALAAARFVHGKPPGRYSIADVLG